MDNQASAVQPLSPQPNRRRFTEKERAEIFARIVEIILADPGQRFDNDPQRGGTVSQYPPTPSAS
jgi:hypothetical protein